MKILLDYFFPVTVITPTQAASTAFLKQVCIVVAPGSGVTPGVIVECSTMAEVADVTDNTEAQQLFNAGMAKVYVLPAEDLELDGFLEGFESEFYTLLISSDFDKNDVALTKAEGEITITSYANLLTGTPDIITIEGVAFTAQAGAATEGTGTFQAATSNELTAESLAAQINAHATIGALVEATVDGAVVTVEAINSGYSGNDIGLSYTDGGVSVGATLAGLSGGNLAGGAGLTYGEFAGVIGVSETDDTFLALQAAMSNRSAFHTDASNDAKNMFYAFGKLLSNALNWKNQQYITMPLADDVETLGDANSLFDDKISFVISDDEFSNRLALFAQGGKAIVAPYIIKNLQIDMQSAALSFVSGNQPDYTLTQAALIENQLQKVIDTYVAREWLSGGTIEIRLEQSNFVASGYIEVPEPKALWKIVGELTQTV